MADVNVLKLADVVDVVHELLDRAEFHGDGGARETLRAKLGGRKQDDDQGDGAGA